MSKEPDGEAGDLLDTEKIRQLRERLGMSQTEAGRAAGFSGRQAWNNIESGRQVTLTLTTLARVAAVLKVDARDLLRSGPSSGGATGLPPATGKPVRAEVKVAAKAKRSAKGKP